MAVARRMHFRDAVILLDLSMPRFDGFQFLDGIRQAAPRLRGRFFVPQATTPASWSSSMSVVTAIPSLR